MLLQGNTALHHAAANGLLPVVEVFIRVRSCDPTIANHVSYTCTCMLHSHHHCEKFVQTYIFTTVGRVLNAKLNDCEWYVLYNLNGQAVGAKVRNTQECMSAQRAEGVWLRVIFIVFSFNCDSFDYGKTCNQNPTYGIHV